MQITHQETIVPNTQAGNYYNLARSEFVPPISSIADDKEKSKDKQNSPSSVAAQNVTIKAEIILFSITSLAPNRIGDNGQVTITIKGARFDSNATVKFVQETAVLNAAKIIFVDAAIVKARLLFTNAPHGVYDVVLTNPNNQTTAATQAVTIETATPLRTIYNLSADLVHIVGRPLAAVACNYNRSNLQSSDFRTQIICNYKCRRTQIICK